MNRVGFEETPTVSPAQHPVRGKVAYIVSAFPTLYETFILYDILKMEDLGVSVELFPLRRIRERIVHPEAQRWIERAHYHPYLSLRILRAQWRYFRRDPIAYLKLWVEVLRGTWGSANYFLGAVVIFPKSVFFAQEMSRQGVGHVHAHFANHSAVSALIIHRLTGIPFSFSARGSDVHLDRHMLREKIAAADFVVAVSADLKRTMVREAGEGLRDKIHVIRGGIDVDRLAPPPRRHSDGPLRILCVARFEEVKGHAYLVEACRILRQGGIPFECRLVGEGPLMQAIASEIEKAGLKQEIHLLGPLSYPKVIGQLAEADVLVLATAPTAQGDREGIPNVLKEGMACGLPVVATSAGGIPELVDHERSGILLQPRDANALADALQRLHDDPALRDQLGRGGRDKIVQEFNLKVSTSRRAALFFGAPAPSMTSEQQVSQPDSNAQNGEETP